MICLSSVWSSAAASQWQQYCRMRMHFVNGLAMLVWTVSLSCILHNCSQLMQPEPDIVYSIIICTLRLA